MLHRPIAIFALLATLAAASPVLAATPAASLDLGVRAFRAGDYSSAVVDLEDAARALTTTDRLRAFVQGGSFDSLATLETTLVYLALAQFRLGDEEAARATLHRLAAAEQIDPTYASLRLGPEAGELEALATALAPSIALPPNSSGLSDDPSRPLPPVTRAVAPPTLTIEDRERIASTLSTSGAILTAGAPAQTSPVASTVMQPRASEPLTVARTVPAVTPQAAAAPLVAPVPTRDALLSLRKAEALIDNGLVAEANAIYASLARNAGVAREVLIESATGLYRTGAYRDAADAFRRFGTFARGEEDLRYYYSVALFESGDYQGAQRELQCALPFLRETDEVLRYQTKIERMQQASSTTSGMK